MKKLQKGRSMIEMLGVLAIVGVLSIGGLAGYQMAMNRYRASALSDYASRCVVVAQTKTMSGRTGGTEANPITCNAGILNEAIPSFLGTESATAYVKIYDDDEGVAYVKATPVPTAVQTVLGERFGNDFIGGVKLSENADNVTIFQFGKPTAN